MVATILRSILAIAVIFGAAVFSSDSRAQGYMGFGLGVAMTDVPSALPSLEDYIFSTYGDTCATPGVSCSSSIEDKAFSGKLFGGYRFTPNFAVEGFFIKTSAFETTASDGVTVTFDVEADITALGVAAVGFVPLSPSFELFGKVGGYSSKSEATGTFTDTAVGSLTLTTSESTTDIVLGAGGQLDITDTVKLRGEYEYYRGDDSVNYLGLNLVVGF